MVPLRLLPVIAVLALSRRDRRRGPVTSSQVVECGDTITADTTLDSDLTGCPNNGIVIGADDITLDLNGHTISGDGKLVQALPARAALRLGGRQRPPRRRHRSQRLAARVRDRRARRRRARQPPGRARLVAEPVLRLRDRRFGPNVIRDSSGNDNPAPDGDGLGVFGSHDLRIVGNSFRRNGARHAHRGLDPAT